MTKKKYNTGGKIPKNFKVILNNDCACPVLTVNTLKDKNIKLNFDEKITPELVAKKIREYFDAKF